MINTFYLSPHLLNFNDKRREQMSKMSFKEIIETVNNICEDIDGDCEECGCPFSHRNELKRKRCMLGSIQEMMYNSEYIESVCEAYGKGIVKEKVSGLRIICEELEGSSYYSLMYKSKDDNLFHISHGSYNLNDVLKDIVQCFEIDPNEDIKNV